MSLWSRIANVFRNDRVSREIEEEFASHLEEAASHGRDPAEARRAFGPGLQLRETSREIRLWAALENTWQDVRYACRGLRRNPAFALTAILSLGLAIGANTAIYSIVDAALLRPLPVPQPDRLFTLEASGENDTFSYPLLRATGRGRGRLGPPGASGPARSRGSAGFRRGRAIRRGDAAVRLAESLRRARRSAGGGAALLSLRRPVPFAEGSGGAELRLLAPPVRRGPGRRGAEVEPGGQDILDSGRRPRRLLRGRAGQVRGCLAAHHAHRSGHLHQLRVPSLPSAGPPGAGHRAGTTGGPIAAGIPSSSGKPDRLWNRHARHRCRRNCAR